MFSLFLEYFLRIIKRKRFFFFLHFFFTFVAYMPLFKGLVFKTKLNMSTFHDCFANWSSHKSFSKSCLATIQAPGSNCWLDPPPTALNTFIIY